MVNKIQFQAGHRYPTSSNDDIFKQQVNFMIFRKEFSDIFSCLIMLTYNIYIPPKNRTPLSSIKSGGEKSPFYSLATVRTKRN